MATNKECPFYPCGFVKWGIAESAGCAKLLPEDGDCGIVFSNCARITSPETIPDSVPKFNLDTPGPINTPELLTGLKSYPDPKDPDWTRYYIGDTHR